MAHDPKFTKAFDQHKGFLKQVRQDKQIKPMMCYFDLGGRGEQVRMLCKVGGIEYEDMRLPGQIFAELKQNGQLPMGSMPVWIEDGETYFQSATIMRMLGRRCGMYSNDPETMWHIDSAMEYAEDQMGSAGKYFGQIMSGKTPDDEGIESLWLCTENLCKMLERRLSASGKQFVAGTDKPTVADIKIFTMILNLVLNPKSPMTVQQKTIMKSRIDRYQAASRWINITMMQAVGDYTIKTAF